MSIMCAPFPACDKGFGTMGNVYAAETLFNACGEEWIREHVPEMQKIEDKYTDEKRPWTFPSGFGIGKARPMVARLWPKIPDEAKRQFLLGQLASGISYLITCFRAFEFAQLKLTNEQLEEVFGIKDDLEQWVIDYKLIVAAEKS